MAKQATVKRSWVKLFETFVADLKISSKEAIGQTGLDLWDSQRRFMHEVGNGLDQGVHKFLCLKSRQLGITTISLALVDVFWMAMHDHMIGCLVTDTEKNKEANREMIKNYVESLGPEYAGFRIVKNNRQSMIFSNGSRLDLLVAGTKKKSIAWGEGQGYALAHLTEIASYGDVEGLKSLEEGFAQKNPNRLFVYESTAKGFNHWRTRWMAGLDDNLTQRSFFIGWWASATNKVERGTALFGRYGRDPADYEEKELIGQVARLYGHKITAEQLAWIRWKRDTAGSEQSLLDQNQPWTAEQAFVLTGSSFFPVRMINEKIKTIDEEGAPFTGFRYQVDGDFFNFKMFELRPEDGATIEDVELKIYEEPVPGGRYVIGFDPAYGRNDHKDHHAILIFRCYADKVVQVAEYTTCDVETKHAAWVCFHLAAAYQNCMVNVELQGPGQMVDPEFDHLRQLIRADVYAQKAAVKTQDWREAGDQVRWYLYHRPDSIGAGYMKNFQSSGREHPVLMHQFRSEFVSGAIVIRSKNLLREMAGCIQDDTGHIGAPESSDEDEKDDRVFAAALAVRAWLDWVRREMLAEGLTYEIVMKAETGETTKVATSVNRIVFNFLKSQDELSQQEPPKGPAWLHDQGLL